VLSIPEKYRSAQQMRCAMRLLRNAQMNTPKLQAGARRIHDDNATR
jgi:hypothetical protein